MRGIERHSEELIFWNPNDNWAKLNVQNYNDHIANAEKPSAASFEGINVCRWTSSWPCNCWRQNALSGCKLLGKWCLLPPHQLEWEFHPGTGQQWDNGPIPSACYLLPFILSLVIISTTDGEDFWHLSQLAAFRNKSRLSKKLIWQKPKCIFWARNELVVLGCPVTKGGFVSVSPAKILAFSVNTEAEKKAYIFYMAHFHQIAVPWHNPSPT